MKVRNHTLGLRVAALIFCAMAILFLGQLISFWWLLITGAVSLAVWMMIWLWPEAVPAKN
jgi:hypothetical protein